MIGENIFFVAIILGSTLLMNSTRASAQLFSADEGLFLEILKEIKIINTRLTARNYWLISEFPRF